MLVLITYDVNTQTAQARKRLRHVAKLCENHGQRVQNSVFECLLEPAMFTQLKHNLESIIDKESDSLRFYLLGKNWKKRVEHIGNKVAYDPEGPLII